MNSLGHSGYPARPGFPGHPSYSGRPGYSDGPGQAAGGLNNDRPVANPELLSESGLLFSNGWPGRLEFTVLSYA